MKRFLQRLISTPGSSSGGKGSPFARALQEYGTDNCSVLGDSLLIGLGPGDEDRFPVSSGPEQFTRFHFLAAPDQVELIGTFLASREAQDARVLQIGTSTDYAASHRAGGYDLSTLLTQFRAKILPKLQVLSLGGMHMLFNGHPLYCRNGDIAALLAAAPGLRELSIFGTFSLSGPIRHGELETLTVDVDDIAGTAGELSVETVTNLLSSDLPGLTSLALLMDEEEDLGFFLPDGFSPEKNMPKLTSMQIDNLDPEGREFQERFNRTSPSG